MFASFCPQYVLKVFTTACVLTVFQLCSHHHVNPVCFQQGQYLPVSLLRSTGFDNFLYPMFYFSCFLCPHHVLTVFTHSCVLIVLLLCSHLLVSSLCPVFTSSCVLIVLCVYIFMCPICTLCSHLPVFPLCSVFTVMYSLCSDGVHILTVFSALTVFRHLPVYSLCFNSVQTSTCGLIVL